MVGKTKYNFMCVGSVGYT